LKIPSKNLNIQAYLMKVWVKLYTLKQLLRLIKLLNENNISKKKLKEQTNLIRLNFHLKLFKQRDRII
jgi:hypothetical protein